MKFTTPFGLGESVCTHQRTTETGTYPDMLMKVVAIQIDLDGRVSYLCRNALAGNIVVCAEHELIGDPAFDQEAGTYPGEAT